MIISSQREQEYSQFTLIKLLENAEIARRLVNSSTVPIALNILDHIDDDGNVSMRTAETRW